MSEPKNVLVSGDKKKKQNIFGNLVNKEKPITIDITENGNAEFIEEEEEPKKRRRGRPKKEKTEEVVTANSVVASNTPFIDGYDETNNAIKGTVFQVDTLLNELKEELDKLRMSRTKGKFHSMGEIASVMSSLASTKLSAIKEMNNVITTSYRLELARAKDLNIDTGDDNKAIMGLYDSIVNTPRSVLEAGFMPPVVESGVVPLLAQPPQQGLDIVHAMAPNDQYTPEQNRMIIEHNPDIKTVVVYNKQTGDKFFKMMNMETKEYIDNVSLPDPFLLEDMRINPALGTARNSNTNMDFPLVVIGDVQGGFGGNY